MDKIYKVLIVNWYGNILGAFTSMKAFEKETFYTKNYDIIDGEWKKEWIMTDYHLDNFDLIKHD